MQCGKLRDIIYYEKIIENVSTSNYQPKYLHNRNTFKYAIILHIMLVCAVYVASHFLIACIDTLVLEGSPKPSCE